MFVHPKHSDQLWGPPSPYSTGTRVLSWGVHQPVHAIDYSPPLSGEVKHE